jgi:hypothetical protein
MCLLESNYTVQVTHTVAESAQLHFRPPTPYMHVRIYAFQISSIGVLGYHLKLNFNLKLIFAPQIIY